MLGYTVLIQHLGGSEYKFDSKGRIHLLVHLTKWEKCTILIDKKTKRYILITGIGRPKQKKCVYYDPWRLISFIKQLRVSANQVGPNR